MSTDCLFSMCRKPSARRPSCGFEGSCRKRSRAPAGAGAWQVSPGPWPLVCRRKVQSHQWGLLQRGSPCCPRGPGPAS